MKIDKKIITERIKVYITRREVLAILVVLVFVFSFYSVKAMSLHPYSTYTEKVGQYSQRGVLLHTAILKNNTLYGNTLSREEYPIPLVESFMFTYHYKFVPGDVVRGNYTLTGKVLYTVSKGKDEVVLWQEELFKKEGDLKNGEFMVNFNLNMSTLDNRTAEIIKELGLKRVNRRVIFETNVNVIGVIAGREVKENFKQNMSLIKDSSAGLYYFTNTEERSQRTLTSRITKENYVTKFGITMRASTAKKVFSLLALIFLTPLMGGIYTIRAQAPPRRFKDLEAYIIEGFPGEVRKKVVLASREDLKKAFELVDKPIMHYVDVEDEVYVIVDGEVAYEYRERKAA